MQRKARLGERPWVEPGKKSRAEKPVPQKPLAKQKTLAQKSTSSNRPFEWLDHGGHSSAKQAESAGETTYFCVLRENREKNWRKSA